MGGVGSTPIHKAAKAGDLSELRVAVQKCPAKVIDEAEGELGYTALHIAAWLGYGAIARELLTRGANPNVLDKEGRTPLHLAALKGHEEVVRALLRSSLKKDTRDRLSHTAYEYAQQKYPSIAALIGPPDAYTAAAPYPGLFSPPSTTTTTTSNMPGMNQPHGYQAPPPAPGMNQPHGYHPPHAAPGMNQPHGYQPPSSAPGMNQPHGYQAPPSAPGMNQPHGYQAPPSAPGANQPHGYQPPPSHSQPSSGATHQDSHSYVPPPPAPGTELPSARQQDQYPPIRPTPNHGKSAADLAVMQLARLGLSVATGGHGSGQKPGWMEGVAAVAGALMGVDLNKHQPQSRQVPGGQVDMAPEASHQAQGRTYNYNELARATEFFAEKNKIGEGGFGDVFQGELEGVPIAVKRMDRSAHAMQGNREFAAEVGLLSRLHHPHVICLMGSCPDQGLLVYELAERGNLEEHLFQSQGAGKSSHSQGSGSGGGALSSDVGPLAWQHRVRIATEAASALLFLHSAHPPIVHLDFKPANLLLTRDLSVKLADVGLSRLMVGPPGPDIKDLLKGGPPPQSVQDSRLVGTLAYVDPEYLGTGRFGTGSDIYALGMVMLQMLTGQEGAAVVVTVHEARKNQLRFMYVIDRNAGAWPVPEAMAFADIALRCVAPRRDERPDLRAEVLPALIQLRQRAMTLYGPPPSVSPKSAQGGKSGSLGGTGTDGDGPLMFVCPITQEIMSEPVVAADGYTYEREAIQMWMEKCGTSPMTNLPLAHSGVVPNNLLRSAIKEWLEEHGNKYQMA